MDFKVSAFNLRRKARRATPLEMLVTFDDGERRYLWMTKSDLRKNIKVHGALPELLLGLECYRQNKLVERPKEQCSNAEGDA